MTTDEKLRPTFENLECLYRDGRHADCRLMLAQIIQDNPNFMRILLAINSFSENYDDARRSAELALLLDPNNEKAQKAINGLSTRFPDEAGKIPFEVMHLTGMTVEQARLVNWPFRGLHRPAGVLLDEKEITPKDLMYGAESAYNSQVKQAAYTLLLDYLLEGRTAKPISPVRVIQGPNYATQQARAKSIYFGTIAGAWLAVLVASVALILLKWGPPGIVAFIWLVLILVSPFILRYIARMGDRIFEIERGREAEVKVVDVLRTSLQSPWIIVRNLSWPKRKTGDIDIVLAGPGGVWAIEVKAYSSTDYQNTGDEWRYKSKFGWRRSSKNPGQQARRNAKTLQEYLRSNNIAINWVQPVVVWAESEKSLEVSDPAVPVWRLEEIENHLEEIWRHGKLNQSELSKIESVLETLIAKINAEK